MSGADVRVVGLVQPSHFIEDIKVIVACGTTKVIPAKQAFLSKDLHRAINQKCLYLLSSAAPPAAGYTHSQVKVPSGVPGTDVATLQRLQALESQNAELQRKSVELQAQLLEASNKSQGALEAILEAVKNAPAPVVQVVGGGAPVPAEGTMAGVADGDAPTFIPDEIKPEGAQARIDVKKEASTSAVSSTAGKLRALRKSSGQ